MVKINGVDSPAKINGVPISNIAKINGSEVTSYFTFGIQTIGINDTFALPLEASGTYNFNVDWGDGNSNDITVWNHADTTHTYATGGAHTINITGTITGWRFNNGGDCTKIYDISSFGPLNLGNSNGYFYGCINLTISATDKLDLSNTTDLYYGFRYCSSITTAPSMTKWDTSAVTNMRSLFHECYGFNQDIGSWDVSSVVNMRYMFGRCYVFDQNVGSWDVSSVENMQSMFYECNAFNQDIGSWDVSKVADMAYMFYKSNAFNQDIGSWDVSTVADMRYMFVRCYVFDQNIGSWDVSKVADMAYMFYECNAFNQDIGSWDVSSVVDMQSMFARCYVFDQNIGSWDVSNVVNMQTMFYGCTLSTANYDALLIGWEAQAVQNNVTFSGGNSKYSAGAAATARAALIADHSWTITDGGQV